MQNESSNKSGASLVSARGTGDGLTLRLLATEESNVLLHAITEYLEARRSFLSGNEVILEWCEGIPADDLCAQVVDLLKTKFQIKVQNKEFASKEDAMEEYSGLHVSRTSSFQPERTSSTPRTGLFAGIENLSEAIETDVTKDDFDVSFPEAKSKNSPFANSMFWDNPDAMIVHATLRSGQKIETENSIVLVGDVNYGAEIVAGGDVIVLGILRGVVHAGAYDENGGGRFIFSLDLQPTQLRIGSVISRGTELKKGKGVEIAYVDGSAIVVEQYNSRNAANRIR